MILLAEFLEALQKNLSHVVVEKRNRQKKKELWTERLMKKKDHELNILYTTMEAVRSE